MKEPTEAERKQMIEAFLGIVSERYGYCQGIKFLKGKRSCAKDKNTKVALTHSIKVLQEVIRFFDEIVIPDCLSDLKHPPKLLKGISNDSHFALISRLHGVPKPLERKLKEKLS